MLTMEEKVASFLEKNTNNLIDAWKENIITTDDDLFKDRIIENGLEMLKIVIKSIRMTPEQKMNDIKVLAYKVAEERAKSNVNMGNFVFNVSIARSEILKQLHKISPSTHELQLSINKINVFFDKFLYFAVSHYTELMNELIEEKNRFIAQSHKDRLTILGQMTSSFVHEFRNPLTSVIGFVQLLKSDYPNLPYIDILQHELDQLKIRISQFLLLSKNKTSNKVESFPLDELIEETVEFIYPRTVDKAIKVIQNLESVMFKGSRDEIKQVLVNIIFNSIEALEMTNSKDRQIMISMYEAKETLRIRISNNGPKIPEHQLMTIFEPFVTTKNTGTGLGLYVCKEIIERHAGNLCCESNDDITTFIITFTNKLG